MPRIDSQGQNTLFGDLGHRLGYSLRWPKCPFKLFHVIVIYVHPASDCIIKYDRSHFWPPRVQPPLDVRLDDHRQMYFANFQALYREVGVSPYLFSTKHCAAIIPYEIRSLPSTLFTSSSLHCSSSQFSASGLFHGYYELLQLCSGLSWVIFNHGMPKILWDYSNQQPDNCDAEKADSPRVRRTATGDSANIFGFTTMTSGLSLCISSLFITLRSDMVHWYSVTLHNLPEDSVLE